MHFDFGTGPGTKLQSFIICVMAKFHLLFRRTGKSQYRAPQTGKVTRSIMGKFLDSKF